MDKNKKYLEFCSTICIFVVQISKANHNKDHSVVELQINLFSTRNKNKTRKEHDFVFLFSF